MSNRTFPEGTTSCLHGGSFAADALGVNGLCSADGLTWTVCNTSGTPVITMTASTTTLPGSLSQTGDLTVNTGSIIANTAGYGLKVKEGTNAKMGESTLVGGTVTVTNTSVGATSRIFISRRVAGGTVGTMTFTISAGTSFTITSSSGTDTSTVQWLIVDPA